jgi:hypothetical protein
MTTSSNPALSVVVVIVSDTTDRASAAHLADCLDALSKQLDAPTIEVIVPHLAAVDGLDAVRQRFPWVTFLPAPDVIALPGGREHHDALRARGLAAARGEIVGLLEDHARPDSRWCASAIAAHRQSHAGIGGAIENGIDHPLNWAVYYCDFGKYQNPLPAGESFFASDANTTYKREALDAVRPVWQDGFREVVVNAALRDAGRTIALDPGMVVYQARTGLTLRAALHERFVWGRSYAATRRALLTMPRRFAYALLAPVLPAVLLLRMAKTSNQRGSLRSLLRALPLILLLLVTWSMGEGIGYLFGVKLLPAGALSPQSAL